MSRGSRREVACRRADERDQLVGDGRPAGRRARARTPAPGPGGLGRGTVPSSPRYSACQAWRTPSAELAVALGVVAPGRADRDAGQQVGRPVEVGGGEVGRCLAQGRRSGRCRRAQPLTPVEAGVPEELLVRRAPAGARRVRVRLLAAALPAANRPSRSSSGHSSASSRVAVGPVQLPRHDHRGVAPAGRALEVPAIGLARRHRAGGSGAIVEDHAVGRWSAARSRSHFARSRRRRRGRPRWARRAASRRSTRRSRCGQSVGMSQALRGSSTPRASCSRLIRSSLQRNHPVRRRSVCTTTPVTSSGRAVGEALDPHVLEAVSGVAGLEHLVRPGPRRRPVDLVSQWRSPVVGSAESRWSMVTSPRSSRASPWVRVISCRGPRRGAGPSR